MFASIFSAKLIEFGQSINFLNAKLHEGEKPKIQNTSKRQDFG